MKRILIALLLVVTAANAQIGSGFKGRNGGASSTASAATLLAIADSSRWTAGSHVHAIKPRGLKSVEIESLFVNVATFTSNVILNTVAGEQVKLGTGSDAAPEIAGNGDTDTGIRWPGGDKMQFVQGGLNSHTFSPYRYTMTYSDGDTIGIYGDGTFFHLKTGAAIALDGGNAGVYLRTNGTNRLFVSTSAINLYQPIQPITNDNYSVGALGNAFKNGAITDIFYIGGKSQTARLLISGENTIAGTDSSWDINATGGVPTATAYHTGTFSNGGRRHYFGPDTTLFNYSKTGRDSATYVLQSGKLVAATLQIGASNFTTTKVDTIFSAGYKPRWVKFTAGTKEWLSPVYMAADTTGKW